jgi:hypothetical protein
MALGTLLTFWGPFHPSESLMSRIVSIALPYQPVRSKPSVVGRMVLAWYYAREDGDRFADISFLLTI